VKAFALVKNDQEFAADPSSAATVHQDGPLFLKAVRSGNYGKPKSKMSSAWQRVFTGELREMIQNDLPLNPISTTSHSGAGHG
jgi:hypothetical protein|tara:strand:- start:219 stop:467 length:249 start_codon:yes stop_codon:yes gene_type:complete